MKKAKKLFRTVRASQNAKRKKTKKRLFKVYQPKKLLTQPASCSGFISNESMLLLNHRPIASTDTDEDGTISDCISIPDFFNDKIDLRQIIKRREKYEAIYFNNFDEKEYRDLHMVSKDTIYSLHSEDY